MMAIPIHHLANISLAAQRYKAGKADSVSGLKVIDPLTLQVTTTAARRHHACANRRAGAVESPVRQRDISSGHLDYLRSLHGKPLGNGPYVYDTYIPGQEIPLPRQQPFLPRHAADAALYLSRAPTRRPTSSCSRPGRPTTTPLPRVRTISNS